MGRLQTRAVSTAKLQTCADATTLRCYDQPVKNMLSLQNTDRHLSCPPRVSVVQCGSGTALSERSGYRIPMNFPPSTTAMARIEPSTCVHLRLAELTGSRRFEPRDGFEDRRSAASVKARRPRSGEDLGCPEKSSWWYDWLFVDMSNVHHRVFL